MRFVVFHRGLDDLRGVLVAIRSRHADALSFARHDIARGNLGQDYRKAEDGAPLGMEIGLSTQDVPAAYAQALSAGAQGLTPPITKPWGQVVAYVRCPDGTLVEICTPI